MLPRSRLVCQEPGLRPIGRSPSVPDKSSWGLGTMFRYSAQILICFIAYIFHFFYSSVSLVGNFAGLPVCTVPYAIVHCNRNEAGHQTSKLPACLAEVQLAQEYSQAFMPHEWWNWQIKWMKSVSMGSFQYKSQVNGECFAYLWVILLYYSTESGLISGMLEVWLFWKLNQIRKFDSCQTAVKLEFESLFQAIRHENVEIWKSKIDFRPNFHILCSQCS